MLRIMKRIVYLTVASAVYVCTLGGRIGRGQNIVLCYHGVTNQQRASFERQIRCVADRVVAIDRTTDTDSVRIGKMPRVALTFDDAFSNLCANVLPLLKKLRLPAVIFAVTNNMGSKPLWRIPSGHPDAQESTMTDRQLTECLSGDIYIGSHTQSHPDLAGLSREDLERELRESKEYLEQLLDVTVHDLAIPHGSYSEDVLTCAENVGYRRIYTLEACAFNGPRYCSRIGRFTVTPDTWLIEFCLICSGAYCWLGRFRKVVNRLRRLKA